MWPLLLELLCFASSNDSIPLLLPLPTYFVCHDNAHRSILPRTAAPFFVRGWLLLVQQVLFSIPSQTTKMPMMSQRRTKMTFTFPCRHWILAINCNNPLVHHNRHHPKRRIHSQMVGRRPVPFLCVVGLFGLSATYDMQVSFHSLSCT